MKNTLYKGDRWIHIRGEIEQRRMDGAAVGRRRPVSRQRWEKDFNNVQTLFILPCE